MSLLDSFSLPAMGGMPLVVRASLGVDGIRLFEKHWLSGKWRAIDVSALPSITVAEDDKPEKAALLKLGAWLNTQGGKRINLHLVLPDDWCYFRLLPWRSGLKGAAEWQAFALMQYREVFGELANRWQVTVANQPPGNDRLACAIPQTLLEATNALTSKHLHIVSVQPALIATWHEVSKQLKGAHYWAAFVSASHVSLAGFSKGRWVALRTERAALQVHGGDKQMLDIIQAMLSRLTMRGADLLVNVPVYVAKSRGTNPKQLPATLGGAKLIPVEALYV